MWLLSAFPPHTNPLHGRPPLRSAIPNDSTSFPRHAAPHHTTPHHVIPHLPCLAVSLTGAKRIKNRTTQNNTARHAAQRSVAAGSLGPADRPRQRQPQRQRRGGRGRADGDVVTLRGRRRRLARGYRGAQEEVLQGQAEGPPATVLLVVVVLFLFFFFAGLRDRVAQRYRGKCVPTFSGLIPAVCA